ncbi:MAG TPA: hypothetical protein VGV09_21275 [Steroidobacteraceae bacterium]|nr:hypothetical protein [Steroidobacteraceae bacterium]
MDRPLQPLFSIRTRLWLLLPLLLTLAQQGAWQHELSHVAYAAAPHHLSLQQAESGFENGVCPSCQSFGQLGSALVSSLTSLPAAVARICPCTDPQYSQPRAQLPAPRNRGPPRLT